MKAIDVHSHLSTKRGYLFQDPDEIAALEKAYNFKIAYKTDDEMVQDFKDADVKVILDGPLGKTLEEALGYHSYIGELITKYPETIIGGWSCIRPEYGQDGIRELERCVKELGMTGLLVHGVDLLVRPNDRSMYPLYEVCQDLDVPALILVGTTGQGKGLPGGGGFKLKYARPIDLDDVAADFPGLTIIASHPAWPWQEEMLAVLEHKPNIFYDVHGWSPKYFPEPLKRELAARRFQNKFVTGFDYPLFSYERLFKDWEGEGYKPEMMENIFYKNAKNIFNI